MLTMNVATATASASQRASFARCVPSASAAKPPTIGSQIRMLNSDCIIYSVPFHLFPPAFRRFLTAEGLVKPDSSALALARHSREGGNPVLALDLYNNHQKQELDSGLRLRRPRNDE